MRIAPGIAAALLLLPQLGIAGELLDRIISKNHAGGVSPLLTLKPDASAAQLDPVIVYGQRSPWSLDPMLRNSLPCIGCDGKAFATPLTLELLKDTTLFLARAAFQQPHCRGEPNDDAAYYALLALQDLHDPSDGSLDRQPNPGLYNWDFDEKNCR